MKLKRQRHRYFCRQQFENIYLNPVKESFRKDTIKEKMASHDTETLHTDFIKQLLTESGLVCVRPQEKDIEEISSYEVSEEHSEVEEEEELETEYAPEEEIIHEASKAPSEALYRVFPTPSLRRVLPNKIREFEAEHRIRVLPEEFKKDIDPLQIPKIAITPHQKYIDTLGEIVGCEEYKNNLAEYWFLDTLANLLRRAQEEDLNKNAQAVLILWFCEWMKEMQHFDAADRQRMLRRFKENMLAAARYVGTEEQLPTPDDVGVDYKPRIEEESPKSTVSNIATKSNKSLTSTSKHMAKPSEVSTLRNEKHISFDAETKYECALSDLIKIIHYIYDLFSTDYLFDLVRSIFTFTPDYVSIDAPYQIQNPKHLYVPAKPKAKKEKTPRKEKTGKKKKDVQPDTAEYIALMELKAKEEKELEELEEIQREEWNKKSHILPLTLAADDEFFNTYWPPPPPPPEPVVVEPPPQVKGKAKPKGGK